MNLVRQSHDIFKWNLKIRKTITILVLSVSTSYFAQQNTLPINGDVGIGTTTPTAKLDVNGKVQIASDLTVKESVLIEQNTQIKGTITVDGNVRFPNLPIIDNAQLGPFDVVLVDHNGTLSRGSRPLDNVEHDDHSKNCNGTFQNWQVGINKIYTNCPEVFVGIHTSAPRVYLDVLGTTFSNKLALGSVNPQLMKGIFHLKSELPNTISDALMIVENDNEKIFQLDNNGLLRTREVKLDKQTWPDYVFEKSYQLTPLLEVEQYIFKHKHLSKIPSEKEVVANGLDLGEMNHLMMEKLEELTLYLIQQEKRLNSQEAEIQALKTALLQYKK